MYYLGLPCFRFGSFFWVIKACDLRFLANFLCTHRLSISTVIPPDFLREESCVSLSLCRRNPRDSEFADVLFQIWTFDSKAQSSSIVLCSYSSSLEWWMMAPYPSVTSIQHVSLLFGRRDDLSQKSYCPIWCILIWHIEDGDSNYYKSSLHI